jgi:uncharacterized lipoprotein YajG
MNHRNRWMIALLIILAVLMLAACAAQAASINKLNGQSICQG